MICGKKVERIRSLLLQNYDIFFNFIVNVRLFVSLSSTVNTSMFEGVFSLI